MGDEEDIEKITKTPEMESLSLVENSSIDLLRRFRGSSGDPGSEKEGIDGVELNLGLSLGGRFGVDRNTSNLVRSSSVATYLPIDYDVAEDPGQAVGVAGLARTSSLPVESEEEWRKRKEMQSLRRMEAKRRRSEKQRNLRLGGEGVWGLEVKNEIEGKLRGRLQRDNSLSLVVRKTIGKGKGTCSSSDLQGSSDDLSPASIQSDQSSQEVSNRNIPSSASNPSSEVPRNRGREINLNALEEMPCVFTKGDGPNGRRVDGILYKYGKGEEVRIMCICHGTFHSPAEFVSHAGGTDLDNPLKQIVVNPNVVPLA